MPSNRITTPTWVRSSRSREYLLLSAAPADGGCWHYVYSVTPGVTITLVAIPGPAMPEPADTVLADLLDQLTQGGPS